MKLPCRRRLGNHDEIPTVGNPAVLAHPLSDQASDPISNNRNTHFLGDGDAEPSDRGGIISLSCEREHVTAVELERFGLHREVVAAPTQPHHLVDATTRSSDHFLAIVTEMRLRPFARRRRKTSRPPRVFLPARNPCVRFRLLLCG